MVQSPNAHDAVPARLEIPSADWQQTPPSIRTLGPTLLQRLEALEARLQQDSTTSQRPPSADSPYRKARKSTDDPPRRKAGGQPDHPGHRQQLLTPTDTHMVLPPQCACRHTTWAMVRPGARGARARFFPMAHRGVLLYLWPSHASW